MRADIPLPRFIGASLRYRMEGLTIWKNFMRFSEFSDFEKYICMISGEEHFRFASPIYK